MVYFVGLVCVWRTTGVDSAATLALLRKPVVFLKPLSIVCFAMGTAMVIAGWKLSIVGFNDLGFGMTVAAVGFVHQAFTLFVYVKVGVDELNSKYEDRRGCMPGDVVCGAGWWRRELRWTMFCSLTALIGFCILASKFDEIGTICDLYTGDDAITGAWEAGICPNTTAKCGAAFIFLGVFAMAVGLVFLWRESKSPTPFASRPARAGAAAAAERGRENGAYENPAYNASGSVGPTSPAPAVRPLPVAPNDEQPSAAMQRQDPDDGYIAVDGVNQKPVLHEFTGFDDGEDAPDFDL